MILVQEGQSPLILCLPHCGTEMPDVVAERLNATGRLQTDLSWRLERVFDFHDDLDVTVVRSTISRYVIDVDRDPEAPADGADPARALCPLTTLDGKPLYLDAEEPGPVEVEQRQLLFHKPFHRALAKQVDRLMRKHRKVIVLDCQSMRSEVRGVTQKRLPVVNIGSANGISCDPDLRNLFVGSFNGQKGFTVGTDEQVTGGFIARAYGRPERGLHAMTLLLAQRAYLRHESPPFEPDRIRLGTLRMVLAESLSRIVDWVGVNHSQDEAVPPEASAEPGNDDSVQDTDLQPVEAAPEETPGPESSDAPQDVSQVDAPKRNAMRKGDDVRPCDSADRQDVSKPNVIREDPEPDVPLLVAE